MKFAGRSIYFGILRAKARASSAFSHPPSGRECKCLPSANRSAVVGLVTPWNFPSAIPAWKLAPALICGNTVVVKPASAAPLSAWRLVEACHLAGVPKGVVNFVSGSGGELGAALVEAGPLKAVSFTGSCEIGQWLHQRASARRLRIQLEMGGKNPTIVLRDCDFTAAVENTVNAAFFSTGQKCTATSRVIVEDSIYDKFVEALVERTRKLKVGNGMEAGIDIGPAVDQAQLETDLKYIEIGRKECGAPRIGGHRLTGGAFDKGYFIEPTIFAGVTASMTIAREEIFGPVLAVMRASDFEDAMASLTTFRSDLSASIQTTNLSRVFEFIHRSEAGLLTVNLPSAGVEYQLPFGGTKDSSFRTQGAGAGGHGILLRLQDRLSQILNATWPDHLEWRRDCGDFRRRRRRARFRALHSMRCCAARSRRASRWSL